MALTDQQVDQILIQQILQHEAELTGHRAVLVRHGALLEAAAPGSPAELKLIQDIEVAADTIAYLGKVITELGKIAGRDNTAQRLRNQAEASIALASSRRAALPRPGPEQPQR